MKGGGNDDAEKMLKNVTGKKEFFDVMIGNSKYIFKIINNKIKIDPGQYIDKRDRKVFTGKFVNYF